MVEAWLAGDGGFRPAPFEASLQDIFRGGLEWQWHGM